MSVYQFPIELIVGESYNIHSQKFDGSNEVAIATIRSIENGWVVYTHEDNGSKTRCTARVDDFLSIVINKR